MAQVLAIAVAVAAFVAPAMGAVHTLPAYGNGWVASTQAAHGRHVVQVTLVVAEQGKEEIRRIATAVSDPSSPSYGEFLNAAEVMSLTAPTTEDMSAVTHWLDTSGVRYQTRHSNVVASMTVSAASRLFNTEFHVAVHAANKQARPEQNPRPTLCGAHS